MLRLLGDYYRVLGVAEQPPIEQGVEGVVYYWLEVFRRVTLIPSPRGTPCWHILIDTYTRSNSSYIEGVTAFIEMGHSHIYLVEDPRLEQCRQEHSLLELRVETHVYNGSLELISVHGRLCGWVEPPPYDHVESIYRCIVSVLEGRDPRSHPLWVDVHELMSLKPA